MSAYPRHLLSLATSSLTLLLTPIAHADSHPLAAEGITSLTNPKIAHTPVTRHHVVLERGGTRMIVVDNAAGDSPEPELAQHRAGYNGVAFLAPSGSSENLFVPFYAGLNFEHIHDGTTEALVEKFEPRTSPMELRRIDAFTVEVYQPPTQHWQLESCGRYRLLEDGVIEYTFECIPRKGGYRNGFIGLFWASYIHQPADKAIQFKGRRRDQSPDTEPTWIEAVTPAHGVLATHAPYDHPELPPIDSDFPLTLVNHPSKYVYTEPWYYGVSGDQALVFMFRQKDRIWMAQSPSGGGNGNPAWDFQWFIEDYEVGKPYGFAMRLALLPFKDRPTLQRHTARHRQALNTPKRN